MYVGIAIFVKEKRKMNTEESESSSATSTMESESKSKSTLTDEDFINYLHTKSHRSLTNVLIKPNFYTQEKPWEIFNEKNSDSDNELYFFTMRSIHLSRNCRGNWKTISGKTIKDSNTSEAIGFKFTRFFFVPKEYSFEIGISMLIIDEYRLKVNSKDKEQWCLCKIRERMKMDGTSPLVGSKRRSENDMDVDDQVEKRSKIFRSEKSEIDMLLALKEWKPFGCNDSSLPVTCVLEEWKPFG